MLYNEHNKAGKELQRRIEQLRAEGKDPNLPHKAEPPQSTAMRYNSNPYPAFPRSAPSPPPQRPMTDSQGTVDESFMLLGGQRVRALPSLKLTADLLESQIPGMLLISFGI
jgi:hypothetical protein